MSTKTGKIGIIHCLWFLSVTFEFTMQCAETNLLLTYSKTLTWNSNFQSIYFYIVLIYRSNFPRNSIYKCVIIEYNVLDWTVSYREIVSFNFFSLRKHKWIETLIWIGNFNPMFSTTSATSQSPPLTLLRRIVNFPRLNLYAIRMMKCTAYWISGPFLPKYNSMFILLDDFENMWPRVSLYIF